MMNETALLPAPPEVVGLLESGVVLTAVADPVRHLLLCLLADGRPQSIKDLAARMNRSTDAVSKHLRILRRARVIRAVTPPGSDGRKQFHELPALFRARDSAGKTVLDFGALLVRVE